MLTTANTGSNIILTTSLTGQYILYRKLNSGDWEPWTGSSWGGVPVLITGSNFSDYDLSDGVYQYRTEDNGEYDYSDCVVIGSDYVGWTFDNYEVPEGQWGEILTSDDLRYSFLWGIDFTASNGEEWYEVQTKKNIEWAVYQLEKKLNIDIYQRQYYCDDELNDEIEESKFVKKEFPYPNKRNHRYNIRLRHRPVQEVTRFDFYSPMDTKIIDLMQWMRLDRRNGQLNFKPRQGNSQTFTSYSYPWNLLLGNYGYRDAFHINMKTGYKNAELIPEDLREIIGKIAALKMLNVIGDGLLAGFSSSSLSLDGISESFSSTQSATSIAGSSLVYEHGRIDKMYMFKNRYIGKTVLSQNRESGELQFKRILDVYKHDCRDKKSYKIWFGKKHITVTEDHSLFTPDLKEIKGNDIEVGTILAGKGCCRVVTRIKQVKKRYMYDLCVEDNENFFANDVLAHNSAYFGARVKVYQDEIKEYISENQNKYGNVRIGGI
ncbi:MAG: Hint domain-containing protein [Spirochaetales bacterium]|nr:Hint domain-containing protein [Spirochaetales bacterium]